MACKVYLTLCRKIVTTLGLQCCVGPGSGCLPLATHTTTAALPLGARLDESRELMKGSSGYLGSIWENWSNHSTLYNFSVISAISLPRLGFGWDTGHVHVLGTPHPPESYLFPSILHPCPERVVISTLCGGKILLSVINPSLRYN